MQEEAKTPGTKGKGERQILRQPRPLALHLAMAASAWNTAKPGLAMIAQGWNPPTAALQDLLAQQRENLTSAELPKLADALDAEIARRAEAVAQGLACYRSHPHQRTAGRAELIWQEGTTRLWDFAPDSAAPPLLAVPSLINRAEILDLDEEVGLCRWLAGQGLRPFLVDWDAPGEVERTFTVTDYICGRLEGALTQVRAATGQSPILLGYCLGGLLALGLAQRRQAELAGLALLATPWDFHADPSVPPEAVRLTAERLGPMMDRLGVLPVDALQSLFFWLDPWLGLRKFQSFAGQPQDSQTARTFVALEDWLNDGVDLAAPVARELLFGWYAENRPARGLWRLAGQPVDPGSLSLPSLLIVPGADRIVPPASAKALAERLPKVGVLEPAAGHIGMIVGRSAREKVWCPLRDWALQQI
ncbi:MAG: alpha/beta fold hydrolase [Pseudomonadota bacterium]